MFCLFHKWENVYDIGKHSYLQCKKCDKRRIKVNHPGGYQPKDLKWLAMGEFSKIPEPPDKFKRGQEVNVVKHKKLF